MLYFIEFLVVFLCSTSLLVGEEVMPQNEGRESLPNGVKVGIFCPAGSGNNRIIGISDPGSVFYIVVSNISNQDLIFWSGRAFNGYKSISFHVVDNSGKTFEIRPAERPAGSEPNLSVLVPAAEAMVVVISPTGKEWAEFQSIRPGVATIQAIYSNDSPKPDMRGWKGKAVSPIYTVEILK